MTSNSGSIVNVIVIPQTDGRVRMKRSCRSSPVSWKRVQRGRRVTEKGGLGGCAIGAQLVAGAHKSAGQGKAYKRLSFGLALVLYRRK